MQGDERHPPQVPGPLSLGPGNGAHRVRHPRRLDRAPGARHQRVVSTSSKLLRDKTIQAALDEYLTNQLFTSVNVPKQLQTRLPHQFRPLAGPISGALREVASQAAARALASGQVQNAWAQANRTAHELLI